MSGEFVSFSANRYPGLIGQQLGVAQISTDAKVILWAPTGKEAKKQSKIDCIVEAKVVGKKVLLKRSAGAGDDVEFTAQSETSAAHLARFIQRGGIPSSVVAAPAPPPVPPPPHLSLGIPNLGSTCFLNVALQLLHAMPRYPALLASKRNLAVAKTLQNILEKAPSLETDLKKILKYPQVDLLRDRGHADAHECLMVLLAALGEQASDDALNCSITYRNTTTCLECNDQYLEPDASLWSIVIPVSQVPSRLQELLPGVLEETLDAERRCDECGHDRKRLHRRLACILNIILLSLDLNCPYYAAASISTSM